MNVDQKILYQVKVILDFLSEEEYQLIPKETIDYIENNYEYDENFSIDPDIPLENQKIDDRTFVFLDNLIKEIESNIQNEKIKEYENKNPNNELDNTLDIKQKYMQLKELVEILKKENSKIPQVKDLIEQYKYMLTQKDLEIEKLKQNNQNLLNCIQQLPKIIKRLFIKDLNTNLLN